MGLGAMTILYPGGTVGKNWWMTWLGIPFLYEPTVMLQCISRELIFIMLVTCSDSCHTFGEYCCARKPNSRPTEVDDVKSINLFDLIRVLMVLLFPLISTEPERS